MTKVIEKIRREKRTRNADDLHVLKIGIAIAALIFLGFQVIH